MPYTPALKHSNMEQQQNMKSGMAQRQGGGLGVPRSGSDGRSREAEEALPNTP